MSVRGPIIRQWSRRSSRVMAVPGPGAGRGRRRTWTEPELFGPPAWDLPPLPLPMLLPLSSLPMAGG
eukprot:CAMPEP_0172719356 /NCGR_PEP_ID=MMETSP1074-20121228/75457_1 /TAXON_ID=2916 /ORGANISM="Ceratium fusus, Strain PA161109" /LENGTH=66 /DNA_ID=CAMNT_0013544697 /DNA_START=156 /DNA_END=356 /DNA_ORIENTATION=-